MAVEDREQTLFEHVDGARDVVAEQPAGDDDQHDTHRHRAENWQHREAGRILNEGGRCRGHEQLAVTHDVGLLVPEGVLQHRLRSLRHALIERHGLKRGVRHDFERLALRHHDDERAPRG